MKNGEKRLGRIILAISSVLAILIMAGCGILYLLLPSQYLALDVNPSIELQTNRLNKVVSIEGVNEDAKAILADFNGKGQDVDLVLEQVVDRLVEGGYLAKDKANDILITSEKGGSSDKALKHAGAKVQEILKKRELSGKIVTQDILLDDTITQNAAQHNISAGKMAMVEQLAKQSPELGAEALAKSRVSELMEYAKKYNIPMDELEDAIEDANDAAEDALDDEKDAAEDALEAEEDAADDAKDAAEDALEAEKEAAEKAEDAAEDAKEAEEEAAEKAAEAAKEAADAEKDALEDAKDALEDEEESAADAEKEPAAAPAVLNNDDDAQEADD
ncbi:MAG: hypothetical protein RR764_10495 [Oscillospiraceae bacterium]